ncbi:hypothetical protein F5K02_01425 [Bacillus amyloliquefaciens]|nr:hypothetical protein B1726_18805 [Bacillus sp. LYLB4]UNE49593.1 hypothetical protein F5K02_01425 [Bacillus amyloliquefaciens]
MTARTGLIFSALIHGDLHPPHILIGENQRVTEWQAAYPVETAKFALQTGQEEHMQMARDMLGLTDPKGY